MNMNMRATKNSHERALVLTRVAVAALAGGLGGCADSQSLPAPSVAGSATATVTPTTARASTLRANRRRSLARLVGQKLVVSYRGMHAPPARLLRRIRRGEVGGVILFSENVPSSGATGVRHVVARLQAAAHAGRNPPLLIATDQEGGDVRRMPGPPRVSPRELGSMPRAKVHATAVATGRSLRQMGIGVDLAPVVDRPTHASSFLGTRAFATSSQPDASASIAFAGGLQEAGVAATAKHYPGLGSSGARNTDVAAVILSTPRTTMARERAGFIRHVRAGTRLVMVSNATYLAYDPQRPAAVSRKIIQRLRRDGFRRVVISDELHAPALKRFGASTAAMATRAGVDLLLFANSSGEAEFRALLTDSDAGRVTHRLLERQVRRIIALKRWIATSTGPRG
ncbi:MAG: beta-N-acetylhexosaminidase [Thermoleophilaceae bacterium]|nr:beta-N-acetylhexosaminidase [Thermoleophilaceae bacterium]